VRLRVISIGLVAALACGDSSEDGTAGSESGGTTTGSTSSTGIDEPVGTTTADVTSTGTTGAVDESSDVGTTIATPDAGNPITEPIIEPCGTLDPHPPANYDIFGERYGDVWGFTKGDREYVALGNTFGLSIVDVTEEPLVEVGYLELPGFVPGRAVRGHGHHVYLGGQGPGGSQASLRVVDVDDPTQPVVVAERSEYTDQIHTLQVTDGVLYLNSGTGACRFLTLGDPAAPVEVGGYYGNDCHDSLAVGDRLFVGGGWTEHFDIVDIGDLSAPAVLGVTAVEPGTYGHSGVLDASGAYFYAFDELHVHDMMIYDVADPGAPTLVGTFSLGEDVVPHNGLRRGNYLYVAWYEAGFVLLDIHDPAAPFEALRFATWPDPPAAEWDGAISLDMNLPSGKVLVSDSREGLFALCVQTPP